MDSRNTNNKGRKRKRIGGGAGIQVECLDIPGVPMNVTPIFVNAIKVTTKFFQRASEPYGVDRTRKDSLDGDKPPSSAYDSWMNRVEAATETPSVEETEQKERQIRMEEAIQRWLGAVKKFVPGRKATTQDTQQEEKEEKASVPYACFLYLWDLQQEHSRVPVRRAALYMSGLLLQRSKDCRFHMEQDGTLSTWITNIVAENVDWKNHDRAAKQLPLLQREANILLGNLVDQGYDTLYPKIGVAAQRLRQQCPNLEATDSKISSMTDWRRLRDIALTYGEEEIRRVTKLVDRSNRCLVILVPRMGGSSSDQKVIAHDEESDDDIDWEDGDDFDDGVSLTASNMEHLAAVERTLAAMESTGGLRGGEIEVDFEKTDNVNESKEREDPNYSEAFDMFCKCVKVLTRRHMTRLSMWVDGLTNADNLVLENSSLVSLPSVTAQQRYELVERLSNLKQEVSSILSSASKLNIEIGHERAKRSLDSVNRTASPRLSGVNTTTSLVLSKRRETKRREARSNRVIIKCRSG